MAICRALRHDFGAAMWHCRGRRFKRGKATIERRKDLDHWISVVQCAQTKCSLWQWEQRSSKAKNMAYVKSPVLYFPGQDDPSASTMKDRYFNSTGSAQRMREDKREQRKSGEKKERPPAQEIANKGLGKKFPGHDLSVAAVLWDYFKCRTENSGATIGWRST